MNCLKTTLLTFSLLAAFSFAQDKPAPDPSQLVARRSEFLQARQRIVGPINAKYLRALEALKQQLVREAKIEAAKAVDNEIRSITEQSQRNAVSGAAQRSRRVVVQCFIEENFKGREYRVEGPAEFATAAAAGIPNDKLASMKIPAGITVTLFGGPEFKGKSETYTGDVPTVGKLANLTTSLKIAATDPSAPVAATAGEPPELTTRRDEYQKELQRAIAPSITNYLRNIEPLKQQYSREGKLDAALAVDNEIKKATQEL